MNGATYMDAWLSDQVKLQETNPHGFELPPIEDSGAQTDLEFGYENANYNGEYNRRFNHVLDVHNNSNTNTSNNNATETNNARFNFPTTAGAGAAPVLGESQFSNMIVKDQLLMDLKDMQSTIDRLDLSEESKENSKVNKSQKNVVPPPAELFDDEISVSANVSSIDEKSSPATVDEKGDLIVPIEITDDNDYDVIKMFDSTLDILSPSSNTDESLQLDELPEFKVRGKPINSLPITSELLKDQNTDFVFYEDLTAIDDKSYLPRWFQNHKISKKQNLNFKLFKNKHCPPDQNNLVDEEENLFNYTQYRYMRQISQPVESGIGEQPRKIKSQVLCRLCRGQNWITKEKFHTHLAFNHGILKPTKYEVCLIPNPKSLFVLKNAIFKEFHVQCHKCAEWIKLGDHDHIVSSSKKGLYFNYFLHAIVSHRGHII